MFLRYLVEFVLPDDKVIPRDDVSLDSGFSDEEMEVDEEGTVEIFMMKESLSWNTREGGIIGLNNTSASLVSTRDF